VKRKYRRLGLRREMARLRRLLPAGEGLPGPQVLHQTVLLIRGLEQELLARLRAGRPPPVLAGLGPAAPLAALQAAILAAMG
jgi:hypothetical protein